MFASTFSCKTSASASTKSRTTLRFNQKSPKRHNTDFPDIQECGGPKIKRQRVLGNAASATKSVHSFGASISSQIPETREIAPPRVNFCRARCLRFLSLLVRPVGKTCVPLPRRNSEAYCEILHWNCHHQHPDHSEINRGNGGFFMGLGPILKFECFLFQDP